MKGIKIMAAIAVAAMMIAVPVSIANDSSAADIKDASGGLSFTASDKTIADMQKITSMDQVYRNILNALGFNTDDYKYSFEDTGSNNLAIKFAITNKIDSDGEAVMKFAREDSGYISFTATITSISPYRYEPFFQTEGLSAEDARAVTEYFGTPSVGNKITVSGDFDIAEVMIMTEKYSRIDDDNFIATEANERTVGKASFNLKGSFEGKSFELDDGIDMDMTTKSTRTFNGVELKDVRDGTAYTETTVYPAMSMKEDFKLGDKTYTRSVESKEMEDTDSGTVDADSDIRTAESFVISEPTENNLKMMLGSSGDIKLADYGETTYTYDGANSVVDDIIGSDSKDSKLPLIIGGVAAVVVIAGIVAFVILRNKA